MNSKNTTIITASAPSFGKLRTSITAEAKAGKAYLRIVDVIGEWSSASSFNVRMKVDEWLAAGIKECEVYINSRGGSVFEAEEIVNELERFGKENVVIRGGALVASAATRICAAFRSIIKRNTQFMVHPPEMYTGGNMYVIESELVGLKNVHETYKQVYVEKTGKTAEEIEAMWSKGDVWMTAQAAKDQGFVDEVEGADEVITDDVAAVLVACAAPHIPDIKNKNNGKMERLELIAMLGLDANATDEQIKAAIQKQKDDAAAYKAAADDAAKAAKAKAEALANKAVQDKKATAAEVPHIVALATADYASAAAMIEARSALPKLSNGVRPVTGSDDIVDRSKWTLDDYLDKDPEAYAALKEEDPTAAKRLEDAYFKSKK